MAILAPIIFLVLFLIIILDAIFNLRKVEIIDESFQKFKIVVSALLIILLIWVSNEISFKLSGDFLPAITVLFIFSCPVFFIVGLLIIIGFKQKIKIGLYLLILSVISVIVGLNVFCGAKILM